MKRLWICFVFFTLCIPYAYAIDQGTVEGKFSVNNEAVALKNSYAHLHDNAEGLLDRPKELRIVLADRDIPYESLRGIVFLPVEDMARENRVHGLLIRLDPRDKSKVVVTLLAQPNKPGQSLMTLTLSSPGRSQFKKLNISNTRVIGELEYSDSRSTSDQDLPKLNYSLKFSAPLFKELPITADLKGKAAQNSQQVKVYRQKMAALKKCDFETVKRLSSERANRRDASMLAQLNDKDKKAFAAVAATDMERSIKRVKRVVVRGDHAVMLLSKKEWATFVREGGQWKTGD